MHGFRWKAAVAALGALVAATAWAQSVPEPVPVKRPDGSVVYPHAAGSAQSTSESASVTRPDGSVVRPNAAGVSPGVPGSVSVKRPDGTVVHQAPDETRSGSSFTPLDSQTRDAQREQTRQRAQEDAEDRIERSRREREAAASNPARQVRPSQ